MIKVQLIVVQGKPEGKTIPLAGPVFRIGRDPSCHLRPSSDQVSRHHAEIAITSDAVVLKDLGSRNGTILNGRTLSAPAKLKSGDLIKIGHLTFAVSIQGAPAPAQPTPTRPSAAAPPSLDEVPQEQVESWLIADDERPIPDRPSGVYGGDTITIDAYKGSQPGTRPPSSRELPAAGTPAAGAATPPSSPEVPVTGTSAAGAARPPSSGEQPVAGQAASAQAEAPAPAPAPAPEAPPPPAQPATPPPARPAAPEPEPEMLSFLEGLEFEPLPEGEAVANAPRAEAGPEDDAEAEAEAAATLEDELIDESNPFYAARKEASATTQEAQKATPKDSSDAAREILNRMLERRRNR